jgi:hypothetical protein
MLAILAYFAFLLLISVAIVVSGIARLIEGGQHRGLLLLKLALAMGVWFTLSLMMLYYNFGFIYGSAHTEPDARDRFLWPLIVTILNAGYCVVGAVLYYKLFWPNKRGDGEKYKR